MDRIKYYGTKVLVLVLALQILNLSVQSGAQSTVASTVRTIGASNQIDCFFEYFYEDICALKGYDDAFDTALHNKSSNSHKFAPKLVDIQMPEMRLVAVRTSFVQPKQNHFPIWDNKYAYLFAQEITPPPPKVSIV
ncbi:MULTISPECIES: hypothetical protein [Chitinophagaceae]